MSYFAGALAIALALAGGAAAYQYGQAEKARRQASEARHALAAYQDLARRERERQVDEVRRTADEAKAEAERLRASAGAARTAAERLRAQLAAARAAAGAARPGAPAGAADGVLADLLGQCTERVRSVAEFADRAHAAGRACEQSYEAVRGREP